MTKKRFTNLWSPVLLAPVFLALCGGGLLAGCGGDDAVAGESTARASSSKPAKKPKLPKAKKPKFDAEARYDGKTLDEYSSGLEDLNASIRKRAMESILKFGVNAFPLKDRMRTMAVEDPDDELRAAAYVALQQMEDPDATKFMLERMRDPGAFQTDRGWQYFLQVAVGDIDAELLAYEAHELVQESVEHGEFLLRVSGSGIPGAGGFRLALAEALITQEHSDEAVSMLLQMLPGLELSSSERVAYVRDNYRRLPGPDPALNSLRAIGDEEAFEAALAILAEVQPPLQTRLATINGFPPANVSGGKKLDAIAAYLPAPTEPEVQQIFSAMQTVATHGGDEEAGPRFQEILTGIAAPGGGEPGVRALAMLYLCDGVAAGKMTAAGLDPVFAALESDAEEVVLGTAIQKLQQLVPRAPDEALADLPERLAETMYARDASDEWSHAVAQGMLDTFRAGMAKLGAQDSLAALAAQAEAHPGHPANFQLLQWLVPMANQLKRSGADMPTASSLAARLLLDGSMGPAEQDWVYRSANLSAFNNTSVTDVETIIAHYEPLMMAESLPEGMYFQRTRGTAMQTLYHLRGNPDQERFLEFARRMAQEASPEGRIAALDGINSNYYQAYAPAHRTGLCHFEHTLAGQPARIKPTVYHSQMQRAQVVPPGPFVTGEPGEAFLLTRVGDSTPPSLGSLVGLTEPLAIAFLDERGVVIALGRTDDPSLLIGNGRAPALTHPEARHALLFANGGFELKVGDETGLDPEFLALL